MDPRTSPYTPNAGAEPQALVGRQGQIDTFDLLLARLQRGRTEQSMIITGLRGVGKTVLLGKFRDAALDMKWLVVELEATKNDDTSFGNSIAAKLRTALFELSPRSRWNERMLKAAAVLKSFTLSIDPESGRMSAGLDVDAAQGFGDHGDLVLDLTDVFVAVGEAARELDRGVVVLLDEVQFLTPRQLESLIQALHKTVQRNLPVTLVGAGLPQIAELIGDAKSYAERLFTFPRIGNLDATDAMAALSQPAESEGASFSKEALALAVEVTGGYPYFIQELGYAVWPIAEGPMIEAADIDDAIPAYEQKLDDSFFRVRLDRATELQRAYLRAMAGLGPHKHKASDVAEAMGRTSQNLAPTRAELIHMGLLYTPEHGYAEFTVPHFDKFMLRSTPTLVVPELRRRERRAPHADERQANT